VSYALRVKAEVQLSRATYRKMIQNLVLATGHNVVALPLNRWSVLRGWLMSARTVIVGINARLLRQNE
jgi:Cu2+-exporting ATPase